MTVKGLAEAMVAAWEAVTLQEFIKERFPQLDPAERTVLGDTIKALLNVPDEVAAHRHRLRQLQQFTDCYKAGTLRDFVSEQHPEWSEEEIERRAAKLAGYFDTEYGPGGDGADGN
jgi:hypothetical protein